MHAVTIKEYHCFHCGVLHRRGDQQPFSDLSGNSEVFWVGIVAYSNQAKEQLLGVSAEVWIIMAQLA